MSFACFFFLLAYILKSGLGLAVVRLAFAFQTKGFVLCFNILASQIGFEVGTNKAFKSDSKRVPFSLRSDFGTLMFVTP